MYLIPKISLGLMLIFFITISLFKFDILTLNNDNNNNGGIDLSLNMGECFLMKFDDIFNIELENTVIVFYDNDDLIRDIILIRHGHVPDENLEYIDDLIVPRKEFFFNLQKEYVGFYFEIHTQYNNFFSELHFNMSELEKQNFWDKNSNKLEFGFDIFRKNKTEFNERVAEEGFICI